MLFASSSLGLLNMGKCVQITCHPCMKRIHKRHGIGPMVASVVADAFCLSWTRSFYETLFEIRVQAWYWNYTTYLYLHYNYECNNEYNLATLLQMRSEQHWYKHKVLFVHNRHAIFYHNHNFKEWKQNQLSRWTHSNLCNVVRPSWWY